MKSIDFSWDEPKNRQNQKKHRISFEEASSAFFDENARLVYDPDHSVEEDRYVLLGISEKSRLIIVCHTYRKNNRIIRIISARKANKYEIKQYSEFL